MPRDGSRDFDFLFGAWSVRNRRLAERLQGSTEWEEFPSVCRARPVLGGLGNMDEFTLERASGRVLAITVRLYEPVSGEWSIYWAATRAEAGSTCRWWAGSTALAASSTPGGIPRPTHLQPVHLDRARSGRLPLGAGLFGGRRPELGDELDHGVRPAGMSAPGCPVAHDLAPGGALSPPEDLRGGDRGSSRPPRAAWRQGRRHPARAGLRRRQLRLPPEAPLPSDPHRLLGDAGGQPFGQSRVRAPRGRHANTVLDRRFDIVLIHDAVVYATTPAAVRETLHTARRCTAGRRRGRRVAGPRS